MLPTQLNFLAPIEGICLESARALQRWILEHCESTREKRPSREAGGRSRSGVGLGLQFLFVFCIFVLGGDSSHIQERMDFTFLFLTKQHQTTLVLQVNRSVNRSDHWRRPGIAGLLLEECSKTPRMYLYNTLHHGGIMSNSRRLCFVPCGLRPTNCPKRLKGHAFAACEMFWICFGTLPLMLVECCGVHFLRIRLWTPTSRISLCQQAYCLC